MSLKCTNCGRTPEANTRDYRCAVCGSMLDLAGPLHFDPSQVTASGHGLWRYRHTFPLPPAAQPVTLGEGGTPLVAAQLDAGGPTVHFKLESLNPTGSYKDRGTAVLLSWLQSQGITAAVEDSSGNAGASFAAYAARAGVQARIFAPAYAAAAKLAQMEMYGAEVVRVPGPRSQASEAVVQAARAGAYYASHVFNPVGLAGLATIAYELVEQLGGAPGTVLMPIGQGSLLLALQRGFLALQAAGCIAQLPQLVGVQAEACAPLWACFHHGPEGLGFVSEGETLAEGVRIRHPLRGDAVLAAVHASGGQVLAATEAQIETGRRMLAQLGFFVEPTSALVWPALRQLLASSAAQPVVAILTGHGLKSAVA